MPKSKSKTRKYTGKAILGLLSFLRKSFKTVVHGRAVRRRQCVGGAALVNFGRRRRGVGGQKHFFLRFTKKFRSILKIFLGTV